MLEVRGLTTQFATRRGTVHAVNGVSFDIGDGEITGIVGESGSGKSVTVRSVLGLIRQPGRVTGGSVRLAGRELIGLPAREMRRLRGAQIGFVGQSPFAALNPVFSIEEQFRNVIRAHRTSSRQDAAALAAEKLSAVRMPGIQRVLKGYAHELSGGMAQRVVIALAMLLDPPLLLADEPTTALDVTVQRDILELLRELMLAGNRSMALVTHDLGVVAQYCHSVIVMYAGKVVERGPVATVFKRPAHPYTLALLDAVPRGDQPGKGLRGAPPNLVRYPAGCPYAQRCSRVMERCRTEAPVPTSITNTREVSCFAPCTTE
jgi:oligopeptide/dipeptide ABC transporter ATP-binding protein